MAVAGCVFNLNRGNFSPITKFIGTVVRLRIRAHRDERSRFKHRDRARHVDSLSPSSPTRVQHTRGENSRVDPRKIPRYRPTQRFNEGNVLFREEHENRGYCNRGRFDLRFRGLSIKGNNRERNIGCPRARIVSRFKITLLARFP